MTAEFALAQLRHLYSLMLAGHVKDTAEAARGLLGPSIEALEKAALSSVPEDVERLVETIGAGISPLAIDNLETVKSARHALSRLATAAARVPGLEADLAQRTRERDSEMEERWKCAEVRRSLESRAETAESERDAARQEVERLERGIHSADTSLDAANATNASLLTERARLTARVAELEREKALAEQREARTVEDTTHRLTQMKARATAAEAQVREVATACERLEQQHLESAKGAATEGTRTAHRYAAGAAKVLGAVARDAATPAPTPAPGGGAPAALWLRKDDVRAALDAELLPPDSEQRRAVNDALASVKLALDLDTPPSGPGGGKRPDGQTSLEAGYVRSGQSLEPSALTPEPSVTHAQLAAVVEAMISETTRVCGTQGYASTYISALHDVWRRVTGGEVPEVLAKARVVEVLAHLNDIVGSSIPEYDRGWRDCVASARSMLGLPLPTAPGGGEPKALHPEPIDFPPSISSLVGEQQRRARIAPTPTPEGPALAFEFLCRGDAHEFLKGADVCKCGAVPRAHDVKPEPAAPEVVWEGDGGTLKVYGDGTWWMDADEPPSSVAPEVVDTIARALAEATRENARLRKEMDVPSGFRLWDRCNDALQREACKAAEAMRERAARAVEQCTDTAEARGEVAARIRALPVTT